MRQSPDLLPRIICRNTLIQKANFIVNGDFWSESGERNVEISVSRGVDGDAWKLFLDKVPHL